METRKNYASLRLALRLHFLPSSLSTALLQFRPGTLRDGTGIQQFSARLGMGPHVPIYKMGRPFLLPPAKATRGGAGSQGETDGKRRLELV